MHDNFPKIWVFLLAASLTSCAASSDHTKPVRTESKTAVVTSAAAPKLVAKFAMIFSSTGVPGEIPTDQIVMDTTGLMQFTTRQMVKPGDWKSRSGTAVLEDPEKTRLMKAISNPNFWKIEQRYVSQQCAKSERLIMKFMRYGDTVEELSLDVNACSREFNLLLKPERQAYDRFFDAIDSVRHQYRPGVVGEVPVLRYDR